MAIFNAYLDESKNDYPGGGTQILTIAGYVASANDFGGHSEAWQKLIDSYLKPIGLRRFHMVDFENEKKGFENLNWHDGCALLGGLIGIINSLEIQPVGASVSLAEWDAIGFPVRDASNDPYNLVMQAITHVIAQGVASSDADEQIVFTFDTQHDELARHCRRAFEYLQANDRYGHRLITIAFSSSYKVCELQAADILAYDTCKAYRNGLAGDSRVRISTKMLALKRKIDHKVVHPYLKTTS